MNDLLTKINSNPGNNAWFNFCVFARSVEASQLVFRHQLARPQFDL